MEQIPLTNLPITITGTKESPMLILRKKINNKEMLKIFLQAAYRDQPVMIQPSFTDKLRALSQMQEKDIIKYNSEEDLYYFLI